MAKSKIERGIVIDWETTGADWNGDSSLSYQGISVGIIIFDTSDFRPIEDLYLEIKYDSSKFKWSQEAENIHGLSRQHLQENGLSREDAACAIVEFLMKHFGPNPNILVLGHSVDFDISFTKQLLNEFGLMFNVHHIKLDTSAIGFVCLGIMKSDELFHTLGLEERGQHNALQDCYLTLEAARRMRMLMLESLYG